MRIAKPLVCRGLVVAALLGIGGCAASGPGSESSSRPTTAPPASPAGAAALVDAGLAAERLGHYSAAERLLEQAVIRDPAEFAASYDLGVLYQTQGRDEQAIAEYVRVNAADPTYVPALYNAATIYSSSNPQLAMSTYRKVVVVQPNDSAAYLNLGLLEARGHELTRARADLLRAIRLQPSLAAAVPRRLLASLDLMTTTTGSDRRQ